MKLLIENYRTIIVIILDLNKKRKEKKNSLKVFY